MTSLPHARLCVSFRPLETLGPGSVSPRGDRGSAERLCNSPKVSELAHGEPGLKPGGGVAQGPHPAPMSQHGSGCLKIPEL